MIRPIRALQLIALKFWSGLYESNLTEAKRRESMVRHPSMHGEPGYTADPRIEAV